MQTNLDTKTSEYPGFFGGEFDVGLIGSGKVGGAIVLGTGRVTLGVGFSQGCVRDQRGDGLEISFNDGVGGLSLELDKNNNPVGIGLHVGPGLEVGVDGVLRGSLSLRDFFDAFFDYLGGLNK